MTALRTTAAAPLLRGERLAFALLVALHLVPIWAFRYFPSTDGPSHLSNAAVIRDYRSPDRPVFREYYVLNPRPEPNWLSHMVLAGLMVVVPPLTAEKLMLTGYILMLPFAVRYALGGVHPHAPPFAVLALPFLYNFLFHMGLYNFLYSLALCFFMVGFWLRHQEHFALRHTMTLAGLSVLLYSAHLVSFVAAWTGVGVLAVWLTVHDVGRAMRQRPGGGGSPWWDAAAAWRRRALLPLVASLPTLALAVQFLGRSGIAHSDRIPADVQWARLRQLESLISYDAREEWLSRAVFILFVALLLYAAARKGLRGRLTREDGLLLVVAVWLAVYFVAPSAMAGGGFISHRMMLFPFLGLILWFGAQPFPLELARAARLVASTLALAFLIMHGTTYAELNPYLAEYVSGAPLIASNTTLLPLSFANRGHGPDGRPLSLRIEPFLHAAGHIAAQRGVVELSNYEAAHGAFPVVFRPRFNPLLHLGADLEEEPPRLEFLTYPQRTGGRVDYVLLWASQVADGGDGAAAIFRQLAAGYELIYTSPRGFMQLYRRKSGQ